MTSDFEKHLKNYPFEEIEQSWSDKDSILYALGLGFGHDPLDAAQLPFVFEEAQGFSAVPTMAVVLAAPGFWARNEDTGIVWQKVLHGEQGMELFRPLPASGHVKATSRVTRVLDKGEGKGALIYVERDLIDVASGEKIATLTSTSFARGNGGFGGEAGPQPAPHTIPDRAPDMEIDLPTLPQAALIYRLSGDFNPLHADPAVARQVGFDAPILHGLCTLGVAGHAVLKGYCDYDAARLKSLKLRFSAPVYPGETIRTQMWRDGDVVSFRARVVNRDVTVLDNGRAEIS
ncbi:MaoC/PaaZ C-terminal domain-containing protein [Sulfitobacter sp. F26169L]|uniref:MaoC family dehydratase n=1 Tax=Sulfitobacter sp. F26169L TaxID=2996015 RepID=UPI0022609D36|nr:MaoC family dehydratase [Sulfitobacter sp. F26169L]MCX7568094.1 MaoC/PaaZ C-terminal domain-containing protein [Sulfitobacter sp. F26169L]